jgi:hypothetical protein
MARLRRSITAIVPPSRPARRGKRLLVVSAVSAVGAYFLDPDRGARRRNVTRDRALALLRRGGREASGQARDAGGRAVGAAHELREKATPDSAVAKPLNDQTLIRKVETELFRDPDVPKADISVDAAGGVVWLRGQAKTQEMIEDLERQAADIPEVERVENLLHLPETPAPTRTDVPEEQRRDQWLPPSSEASAATAGVSAEEPVAEAEPPPDERAARREGRATAPLGSEESGEEQR